MIVNTTPHLFSRRVPAAALLTVLTLVLGAAALLAQPPADALFRDFQPTGEFVLEMDGKAVEGAEIFASNRAGAYLIMAPGIASPVLINQRSRSVQRVHLMKVSRRADGAVDILADAEFEPLGAFGIGDQQLTFTLNGKPAALKVKPPLLGWQNLAELKSYKPEYVTGAAAYTPDPQYLAQLEGLDKEVTVQVFFATWCAACTRLLPNMLKVQESVDTPKLRFEFYGLPHELAEDPVAREMDIKGIPTGVVFVADREVGRLTAADWNAPEKNLYQLVAKAN